MIVLCTVGARARQASHGIQKAPPVSGDCFWQIERIDNPLSSKCIIIDLFIANHYVIVR